jgi:carboxylesterase
VTNIPESESLRLFAGKTGVLMLHGFTGSPASIKPWALALHERGLSVSVPRLPGHGTHWSDLNKVSWQDWYETIEKEFLELKKKCDQVFVAGFSVGGALALRLSQIRGSEIAGTILLNASIYDERARFRFVGALSTFLPSIAGGDGDVAKPGNSKHGYDRIPLKGLNQVRKLWEVVERDLYLVDLPLMVAYSLNDHVVHPVCSETIIDNVYSADIREVVFEKSFHNVALDHDADLLNDETMDFILDVLSGELSRGESIYESDERELIDAEFESIVSGLSLDESAPTTYLDELDARPNDPEGFTPPNPRLPNSDQTSRLALLGIVGGGAYMFFELFSDIDLLGMGPWPGLLAFIGGLSTLIWRSARAEDDFGDGVEL